MKLSQGGDGIARGEPVWQWLWRDAARYSEQITEDYQQVL